MAAHADVMLRGTLADCGVSTMNENGTEVPEQVVKFEPKARPRSYDTPLDEAGQAIIAKIQRAADLANENCDRAMKLAYKLSMKLRAAEDRINQLEAEVELFRDRAVCAERKRSRKSSSLRGQPTLPNKARFPKTPSYDKC